MSDSFRQRVAMVTLAVLCALPAAGAMCTALCAVAGPDSSVNARVASSTRPAAVVPNCHTDASANLGHYGLVGPREAGCTDHPVDAVDMDATTPGLRSAVSTSLQLLALSTAPPALPQGRGLSEFRRGLRLARATLVRSPLVLRI